MQYSTRPQAEWNIVIPRVVINLISNTVKVQYLFYYIHYTCIQNRVRSMKTETKHSSKTTLRYQRRNATVTVRTWLAPTCVLERRHCYSERMFGRHKRLVSAFTDSRTTKAGRYLDGAQTMTQLSEYFRLNLRSVLLNNKAKRCKANSSFRSTHHYLL